MPRHARVTSQLSRSFLYALSVIGILTCSGIVLAQTPGASDCSVSEPPLTANRPNLFNQQQEQWLGDAMAAQQEPNYTLLPEKDSEFLTKLGQKLLAQLPPTQMNYHFRVYESSELNGFSLAGGYVYVSRKLITDAKSEDEIAGVLSHEIGHIYTHQIASALTREMKRRLNLSSLGERADVWDKYQLMFNASAKAREDLDESEAEKDEMRADAVGLYAMMRAGFAPQAFAANLERIADSKGRNGNFLTDILGGTSEVGMRVRTARKISNVAPDACKRRELKSSPEFLAFQQAMIAYPINPLDAPTPGLTSIKLDLPIRPGLNWIRFSPDGKYVLAQNESYVYVLSAHPLKQLFKVYAPFASAAHFSPDSKHLVFHFQSLRVEDWDVETGKRNEVHELVEYRVCDQSELSPDGKLLACALRIRDSWQISLELFDVASGKVVYQKSEGFLSDGQARAYRMMSRPDWDPELLAMAFSPDSHYLLVAAVASRLALDLKSLKPVKLNMGLGNLVQGRLTFTAPDQVLYDCDAGERDIFMRSASNVCVVEFPTGVPVKKFVEGWESLWPVAEGSYVVAAPLYDSVPHLVDLTTGKATMALKFTAADVHGKMLAAESGKGGVLVGEIGSPTVETVDLPEETLPYVRATRFSPDGHYLAISNENRGAIWDLQSNKQMLLTRSFRSAWFDTAGQDQIRHDQSGTPALHDLSTQDGSTAAVSSQLYLQLPAGQARLGQNVRLDLKTGSATEGSKYVFERIQLMDVAVKQVTDSHDKDGDPSGQMVVYDDKTGNSAWRRKKNFDHISQQEPGSLIIGWAAGPDDLNRLKPTWTSDAPKNRLQGWVTEILDSKTGELKTEVVSPDNYGISEASTRSSSVWGNLLAVRGSHNNTVVYDVKTGARLMAFWGWAIAGDGQMGLIAAQNRDQELIVYEVATGREMLHVTLDAGVRAAQFVPTKKRLLAVTSNQRVYTLDIPGTAKQVEVQTAGQTSPK